MTAQQPVSPRVDSWGTGATNAMEVSEERNDQIRTVAHDMRRQDEDTVSTTRRSRKKVRDPRGRPRVGRFVGLIAALIVIFGGAGATVWWLVGNGLGSGSQEAVAPGSYGSDATLDVLWERCRTGVLTDCDELYFSSPAGSDYESFGASCGNREPSPGLCAPQSEGAPGLEGGLGSDPELDLLWIECEEGNMFACDDLFFESPPGTAYEEFGATCGGRGPGAGDCTARF